MIKEEEMSKSKEEMTSNCCMNDKYYPTIGEQNSLQSCLTNNVMEMGTHRGLIPSLVACKSCTYAFFYAV